jgi:hypothetical protein
MYSTALKFYPVNADIDECESDFIGIFSNTSFRESPPLQVLFGEAKTHHPFDANDARNLGMLADAIPPYVAEAFIMFSKTYFFTPEEITVARELNRDSRRVILWSRDQLEGKYAYARASDKLGQLPHMAISLKEMADYTDTLFSLGLKLQSADAGLNLAPVVVGQRAMSRQIRRSSCPSCCT